MTMNKQILTKLALYAAGTVLSAGAIDALPATAASFTFNFNDVIYGNVGSGSLQFNDSESNLGATGGTGLFSLGELGANAVFSYAALSPVLGVTHTPPPSVLAPSFQFTDGNLSGLYFSDNISEVGDLGTDAIFTVTGSGFFIGPGFSGVPILGASFGTVEFEAIASWQDTDQGSPTPTSVPEHSSIFGLIAVLGIGSLFTAQKRSVKHKHQLTSNG